jgi:tetratricopeptide (TPR) repeat protein
MKKLLILFVLLCAVIVCAVVYLNGQKIAPSASVAETAPVQTTAQTASEKIAASNAEPAQTVSTNASGPGRIVTPVAPAAKTDDSTNSISKIVDALLSAKNGAQKHELFQQLIKSGQMDAAIAELKQRMADNPNDPEIPTTLGEAQLNQLKAIKDAGGDTDQLGIMAMEADQNFNNALKIDPSNYEAQLVKAMSMTYWPPDSARDAQVVQTLSSLIDRQESMPSDPSQSQAYIYLGNEYQKIGQTDKAQATWQLGLAKFPNDPTLQQKVSGP